MNKIDELIAQYCPNGVEYKKLGEVCEIKTGQQVSKIEIQQNPGKFPVINSGREPLGFINQYNTENNPIGITTRGAGVGSITWCEGKYFRGNLNYSATIKNPKLLDVRFLYHILINSRTSIQKLATFNGIPALNKSKLEKLTIPIPPLPVQQEIVNILDKFTELEAKLEAELEARRKQYEYYRNQLLTPVEVDGKWLMNGKEVEWKTLGEVGRICMCKRVMKKETSPFGDIPFYKIGTFGKEPDAFISTELYEKYKEKYSFPKTGDVLISASGTIGRAVIYDGKPAYFQDSNIVWIDNDEKEVLNRFLFYLYGIIKWKTEGGTIARLYNDNLAKIKIPIPPLSEQERIVEILDKFEALVNDISEGLPAEIEARRKQYEYYRGKLLLFQPVTAGLTRSPQNNGE